MLATSSADSGDQSDWEGCLPKVCLAYNTSVQPTTGYTPFFLMFGRQARLPLDIMYGPPEPVFDCNKYAAKMRTELQVAYDRVHKNMPEQLRREKELYDKKIHGKPFEEDDLVWLHSPVVKHGRSRKLHLPWSGPYRVVKKLSDAVYRIQELRNKRRRVVVHFDRLKPYLATSPETPAGWSPPNNFREEYNQQPPVGHSLELLEEDDPPLPPARVQPPFGTVPLPASPQSCYPQRTRRPPDRFAPYITH